MVRPVGFEALAVRWLFPGKKVRLEANCLDCGEPMVIEMKDEVFLSIQPEDIVGYTYGEVGGTIETRPYR
jgi:hypothetical protein